MYHWSLNCYQQNLLIRSCCLSSIVFGNFLCVPCSVDSRLSGDCWWAFPCCFHTSFYDVIWQSRRSLCDIDSAGPGFAPCFFAQYFRSDWLISYAFIVQVNWWKNRASSELLYKSIRPQVSMVYRLINHMGCSKNTRRIRKSRAAGEWFTNSSLVLPISLVVYQPINHRNLRSIA